MLRNTFKSWLSRFFSRRPIRSQRKGPQRCCRLEIDELENRLAPAAIPLVALGGAAAGQPFPTDVLIGEVAHLSVTFENDSLTATGYGPYIDVFLPATGIDGRPLGLRDYTTHPTTYIDGITYVPGSAKYLVNPITPVASPFAVNDPAYTLTTSPGVNHPLAQSTSGPIVITPATASIPNSSATFYQGDQLAVFRLPFGSFTPEQPKATITFDVMVSNLADANALLSISACGGFQYGTDPLDNPSTDPSIAPYAAPGNAHQGAFDTKSTTPRVMTVSKTYKGREDETATGPNFQQQYEISVNVAAGQTISDVVVTDQWPDNFAFKSVAITSGTGAPFHTPPLNVAATGESLVVKFPTITGSASASDASFVFDFFVPELKANNVDQVLDLWNGIIGPPFEPGTNCAYVPTTDTASATGKWIPIDVCDQVDVNGNLVIITNLPPVGGAVGSNTATHTLKLKAITIAKSVAKPSDPKPGDTVTYTLDYNVSDFFGFENVVVTDTFSDGQVFNSVVSVETGTTFTFVNPGVLPSQTKGTVTFNVGELLGAGIPIIGTGVSTLPNPNPAGPGTKGKIIFTTKIAPTNNFVNPITYAGHDSALDQGDRLSNTVEIDGGLLNYWFLDSTGIQQCDTSSTLFALDRGILTKTVYAINGVPIVYNPATPPGVKPLDTVTYELRYTLPHGNVENLKFKDYLPLPIFQLGTIGAPAANFTPNFTSGTSFFKAGPGSLAIGGVIVTPSSAAASNWVEFDFHTIHDSSQTARVIDLLFTVTVSTTPFADGLYLTNLVQESESSTNGGLASQEAIAQVKVMEPLLYIRKGVVATDRNVGASGNPPAAFTPAGPIPAGVVFMQPGVGSPTWDSFSNSPAKDFVGWNTINSAGLPGKMNSDLINVDAADIVTFAIVVENKGSGPNGAFNVTIKDTLPAGFKIPNNSTHLNLRVTDGTGKPIAYTDALNNPFGLGGTNQSLITSGFFGLAPYAANPGIKLRDNPGAAGTQPGAIDPFSSDPLKAGWNVIVITYDLQVDPVPATVPEANEFPPVEPLQELKNTATLVKYTSTPLDLAIGTNFVPNGLSESAKVTIAPLKLAKSVWNTEINIPGHNEALQAVIGELVTYRLALTVPEGIASNVVMVDQLDPGLAYVSAVVFLSSSPDLQFNCATTAPYLGSAVPLTLPGVANTGHTLTFNLGQIVNKNTNNLVPEQLFFFYKAVVLNVQSNQDGTLLNNTVAVSWAGHALPPVKATNVFSGALQDVVVIEPQLTVNKTATPNHLDANGVTTFVITVSNPAPGSNPNQKTDAFDVWLTDLIPTGFTYEPGTVAYVNGVAPSMLGVFFGDTYLKAVWNSFLLGQTSTIRFNARLNAGVLPCQVLTNSATVTWTSLSDAPTPHVYPRSNYNTDSTERTGTNGVGTGLNNYALINSAQVTVNGSDILGTVYADCNNSGVFDAGDHGIANVIVTLTGHDNLGNLINTSVTTGPSGNYSFTCLRPSDANGYTVTETQPAGYPDGPDQVGTNFGGTLSAPDSISHIVIAPNSNTAGLNYNFGEHGPATISGFVYLDVNTNGVKDPGEANIPGVTIHVTGPGGPYTATTAGDGSYSFTGLLPGTYAVSEVQPVLYGDGTETVGSAGGTLGADTISNIVVTWCTEAANYNFGEVCLDAPTIPNCPPVPSIPDITPCPPTPGIQPPTSDIVYTLAGDVVVLTKPGNADVVITQGSTTGTLNIKINTVNFGDYAATGNTFFINTTYSGTDRVAIVLIGNYSANIVVDTGAGDDTVLLSSGMPGQLGTFGFLCIDTGTGDDLMSIEALTINGYASIHGGQGNDTATIGNSVAVIVNGDLKVEKVNTFTLGSHAVVQGSLIMHNENDLYSPNTVTLNPGSAVYASVYYEGDPGPSQDDIALFAAIGTAAQDSIVLYVGDGANSLTLGPILTSGSLFFTGGSGVDHVDIGTAHIQGDAVLHLGDGDNVYGLWNLFKIDGNLCIEAGNGVDRMEFGGSVQGYAVVRLGDGNNEFFLLPVGSVAGTLYYVGGLNTDQVVIDSGETNNVDVQLGDGADEFVVGFTSTVTGWLDGGPGADILTVNGTLGTITVLNIP